MASADDARGDTFRGLLLLLRGRTGLTQRDLAARLGVHVHSLQGWEAGTTYPGVTSLRSLVTALLQARGFAVGREAEEADELWSSVVREAPRLRTPFDHAWFADLLPTVRASAGHGLTIAGPKRNSWGEAPDIERFVGRAAEREQLSHWVRNEGCRVVAVLGLGGIGKSQLATRLAHDLAPAFDYVIWRSLLNAPTPHDLLAEILGLLAPGDGPLPDGESARLRRLMVLVSEARCLIVLDNYETVLDANGRLGSYRAGYECYGTLLKHFGEMAHRSCVVVTSREDPPELGPLRGERGRVRAIRIGGLGVEAGHCLLSDKGLEGDEAAWQALVERCGGNGLALRLVGEAISELFGRSINEYLASATPATGLLVSTVLQLVESQIERLSGPERALIRWLGIERDAVSPAHLIAELDTSLSRRTVLEAMEGLRRRSLLESNERQSGFALQPVVLEYVTETLVEEVAADITSAAPLLLCTLPLVKATSRDYIRSSQERMIARPVLDRLLARIGSLPAVERWLLDLLDRWRGRPPAEHGYGPGNVVNLLRLLRGELCGTDLSRLTIRQAYLQEVDLQDARLTGAELADSFIGEAFDYPSRVALSADGRFMAAGTATGDVYVWKVADRTLQATFRDQPGGILSVALNGNGRLVAAAGYDGAVRLWETATGRLVSVLEGHTDAIYGVSLTGDGRRAASGSMDQTVRVWDVGTERPLATLRGHDGGVRDVALSRDGRLVASGGYDEVVRLCDADSGRHLTTLCARAGGVWGVALSADGQRVASGGADGAVRVWDASGGAPLTTLHGHGGQVWSVALSDDGQRVASGSADSTVRLAHVGDGRHRQTLHGHTGQVWSVALRADGHQVVSGSEDGTLRMWEHVNEAWQPLATLRGHMSGVWSVAASSGLRTVASGSSDGCVRLWDVTTGRPLARLRGHAAGVWSVSMSGDGRVVASGSHDTTVRLWDTTYGRCTATLRGHSGGVWGVAVSADGRLVASGSIDGSVRFWDAVSGRSLASLQGHHGGVRGIALSRDGSLAASCGFDGTVRLWVTSSARSSMILRGHVGGVRGVALSGDGRLIASGGLDGTVRLWETAGGRLRATLHGQRGGVWGVALSEDGRVVGAGGHDGTIRLWETTGSQAPRTLHGHRGGIWGLALSEDGARAVSGGIDANVRVWATDSGLRLQTLRGDGRYERVDITGLTGVTGAQRRTLVALGARDQADQ